MANAYIPPGISAQEATTAAFSTTLGVETNVCLVGPAAGFQTYQEVLLLNDRDEVALSAGYANVDTIVVRNAADLTQSPLDLSTSASAFNGDYILNDSQRSADGTVTIRRAMQTAIGNGDVVLAYFENSDDPVDTDAVSTTVTLDGVASAVPTGLTATTQQSTLSVQKIGVIPTDDYTISGAGTATVTVTRESDATVLRRFQQVYVDYDVVSNARYVFTLGGTVTGGTWSITSNVETAAGLAYNISASSLKTALVTAITHLTNTSISVSRTGSGTLSDPYQYTVDFIGELAGSDVLEMTAASALTGTGAGVTVNQSIVGGVHSTVLDYNIQMDWDTTDQTISLPAWSTNHVVKNRSGATAAVDSALTYTAGASEDGDYMVDVTSGNMLTLAIRRSRGSTFIGNSTGRGQVVVEYQATPTTYWLPTRHFSLADIEDQYGAAFNSDGSVNSPLSFGALLLFDEGASSVVCQPLFAVSGGEKVVASGQVADWQTTLESLRDIEDVNVIVPLLSTGSLPSNDALSLSILQAVRSHIAYMRVNASTDVVCIAGEDGTGSGTGSPATLQAHGEVLGLSSEKINFGLVTPGSFGYSNPVSGTTTNIGGQYAACAFAGNMAGRGIAASMTRKPIGSLRTVNVIRSKRDKDEDAAHGLIVLESQNGLVRVRHSITTATASPSTTAAERELSVVRAKFYVIREVRRILDTQVVGEIPADDNAPFTVQVLVSNILQNLISSGVIAGFNPASVQARRLVSNPTAIEVRFTYQPNLPLNNISIKFSLDLTSGLITEGA